MNPLESRKQLLIAESELNRAQLVGDMAALTADVRTITGRAKSFGSIASSAAVLVAALAAFKRGKPVDADAKPSRLQTILRGAGLISTLWLAFRSKRRDRAGM
jgi:collagenase-like PrtC family protease